MKLRTVLSAFLVLLMAVAVLAETDSMDAIKSRMKARYPNLTEMKDKGMVGETHLGYVEATNSKYGADPKIKELVAAENSDRKMLYEIIAKQTKTKPEDVGKQNALRIFKKAGDDEWFQGENGEWKRKKDVRAKKK